MPAFYRVEHESRYVYASSVSTSQHMAFLRPRELRTQRVAWAEVAVEPPPARRTLRLDYFGNLVDQFTVMKLHFELVVCGRSLVEVRAEPPPAEPGASPPWELVRDSLLYRKDAPPGEAAQYAYASPYVTVDAELGAYAKGSFPPGRPFLEAAIDLTRRMHADFRFDATATTLTTPVRRVLAERRGVCQDFAHLQISCLRSLGLAARYVSGYLLTDPPEGQERLVGADASHAWLAVHCPRFGWVDLDPTNGVVAGERHVTLAWARDYGDLSPLRGVILGGAKHALHVGVTVMPLEPSKWDECLAEEGKAR